MSANIKLKRSAQQGKIPATTDLALGELAVNTYDGKVYVKKSVSGTETVVEVGSTATTPYSLPQASTSVLGGVKVDGTSISINGSGVISAGATATEVTQLVVDRSTFVGDGSQLIFDLAVTPRDINHVEVYIDGVYQLIDTYELGQGSSTMDQFTGNGSMTSFGLSATPQSIDQIQVFISGVYQQSGAFTLSGSTITFSTAIPNGYVMEVRNNVTDTTVIFSEAPGNGSVIEVVTLNSNLNFARYSMTTAVSTDTLNIGYYVSTSDVYKLYWSGVYQNDDAYSITGQEITLSETVDAGEEFEIIIMSNNQSTGGAGTAGGTDFWTATATSQDMYTPEVVDTFLKAVHRTAKYLIQAESNGIFQAADVLLIQNGTTVSVAIQTVNTGSTLINIDGVINGPYVELTVLPTQQTYPTVITLKRLDLPV